MNHHQARRLLTASLLLPSAFWLRAQTAADTTSTTVTTSAPIVSAAPITAAQAAQMEFVKRQQLLFSSNQAVTDGQRLLDADKYDDAAARFQYALDNVDPGGTTAHLYNRAAAGMAAAKAGQAGELAKDAKFAQAAARLQEAIDLQPNDPSYPKDLEDLRIQQVAYEKQVDDPEGVVNNPAVTDEFKDRVATVQKLLFQGDAYFRTGQYEKSEETYSKILILDPYNKAARSQMDHIERYRFRAAGFRHEEYEQKAMLHINQGWAEAISPDVVIAPVAPGPTVDRTERVRITRKLQTIIIDKVNFDKLDISTVVQFLQDKSKELDPDHIGVNFVLRLSSNTPVPTDTTAAAPATGPAAAPGAVPTTTTGGPSDASLARPIHREVSITLDNVPLSELLNYITQQTNLQFSVEDYAVYLRPSIDEGETLSVRTFLVPPSFFSGSALRVNVAAPTDSQASTVSSVSADVQGELSSRGIRFPAGATATFLPGSSKLVVRNTPEQLDLISNLIENLSKETPQIQIETKLAEFNQTALKSLSFNYTFGTPLNIFQTGPVSALNIGGASNLRDSGVAAAVGDGGLTPDSIDSLIEGNPGAIATPIFPITGAIVTPNSSNLLQLGAVIDHVGFSMIIKALNNLSGVSLLSAPSVTTQNGLKANIDIVREFPYPTSFEKPKLSSTEVAYSSGVSGPSGPFNIAPPLELAIPPTPREFVTQDVGVSLEVKPTTYPDQRIDLDITKAQVIDFDGFIDYGVPITARLNQNVPAPTDPGVILTQGTINQPVFNLRSVVTNLQVLDGQTAVLGGLLREDTQEINDKVPVLGDLPLVGRLFQSKVSQRIKKNLLIFVTARLIRSNGRPEYIKTLNAEPEEEKLPEPDQTIGPGVTLPPLPENTPNS